MSAHVLSSAAFDPYRACAVCAHGRTADGNPARGTPHVAALCACSDVAQRPLEVERARAHGAPCGPEAKHMHIPVFRWAA